jgi:rhodanese-related sulfurtransferase
MMNRCSSYLLAAWASWQKMRNKLMSDASSGDPRVQNLTSEEVARGIQEGRMLLVDVREPNEVDAEAYPDAVVIPLSSFDPTAIPDPQGKQVVFACRSGRRSVTASLAAQERGYPYNAHLAGGILAWKAAGFPTET